MGGSFSLLTPRQKTDYFFQLGLHTTQPEKVPKISKGFIQNGCYG